MRERATDFIRNIHEQIQEDYKHPDGYSQHCGLLAIDIAQLILENCSQPELYSIRGIEVRIGRNETLYPALYHGKLAWGGHTVCGENEIIYDPLIGYPLHISEYVVSAFLNKKILMDICIPKEEIAEFIRRK